MTTNQDGPNTAGAAEPVAWMYTSPHGDKELILNYGCEYAKRLRKSRWTEIPLYAHPPENPPKRPSVVPDEVVEIVALSVAQYLYEPGFEPLADPETRDFCENVARAAITAAIPAIKAQVLAEIVAWLRMGEHVHSRSGSIESEMVFKLIADALERRDHETTA